MIKLIVLLTFISFASCVFAANETVPDAKIKIINTYNDIAVIRFTPSYTDSQDCSYNATDRAVIRFSDGLGKEMFATALSAAASKATIRLGINGCDSTGMPKIYRVDVVYDL